MIKEVISYFTLEKKQDLFRDCVSGKMVSEYVDVYGASFMKDSRWSFFKVERA